MHSPVEASRGGGSCGKGLEKVGKLGKAVLRQIKEEITEACTMSVGIEETRHAQLLGWKSITKNVAVSSAVRLPNISSICFGKDAYSFDVRKN